MKTQTVLLASILLANSLSAFAQDCTRPQGGFENKRTGERIASVCANTECSRFKYVVYVPGSPERTDDLQPGKEFTQDELIKNSGKFMDTIGNHMKFFSATRWFVDGIDESDGDGAAFMGLILCEPVAILVDLTVLAIMLPEKHFENRSKLQKVEEFAKNACDGSHLVQLNNRNYLKLRQLLEKM